MENDRLKLKNEFKILHFALSFCFLIFTVSILPLPAHALTIAKPSNLLTINSGLIGWWTFDGADMTSNVRDRSGQGNHANLSGFASTTTVPGKIGQALVFDGDDDRVDTTLDFSGLTAFTVSQWIYPRDPDQYDTLWSADTSGACTGEGVYYDGTSLRFRLASLGNELDSVPDITDTWTHVISVYDGSTRRVYFDNVLVYDQSASGAATIGTVDFQIGAYNNCIASPNDNFEGYIDDVRVYDRAVTDSERAALYNAAAGKFSGTPNVGRSSLAEGLIGHWTFDGAQMNPNVRDTSGNSLHGNLVNIPATTTRAGKVGQSLYFDGTNDAVRITDPGTDSILDFGAGETITIAGWVNSTNSSTGYMGLLSKSTNYYLEIPPGTANAARNINFGYNDGNWRYFQTTGNPISPNTWYHIAATYTFGTGSSARLYINGALSNASWVAAGDGTPVQNNSQLHLGSWDATQENLVGMLDDMRIYDRGLSADEIRELYNTGAGARFATTPGARNPSLESGLVGHWTFDGSDINWATNQALDKSGNGNHGSIENMPTTTSPRAGKLGQALSFVPDSFTRIDIGTPDSLDLRSNYTLALWTYRTGDGNSNGMLRMSRSTSNVCTQSIYSIQASEPDDIVFCTGDGTNSDFDIFELSSSALNRWVFIVCTLDDSDNKSCYENGTLIDTVTNDADTSLGTAALGLIGSVRNNTSADNYFPGLIDDVRIYNRVLSANEIKQLYNMGR